MTTTVQLKRVLVGTDVSIVQEGIPGQGLLPMPAAGPSGVTTMYPG